MTKNDHERFGKVLLALASAFRTELDEMIIPGYWMGLSDLPLEKFERACKDLAKSLDRMPTVADIREATRKVPSRQRYLPPPDDRKIGAEQAKYYIDQIRKRLADLGVTLEDRPGGTTWRVG